jgi:hypothetical protein
MNEFIAAGRSPAEASAIYVSLCKELERCAILIDEKREACKKNRHSSDNVTIIHDFADTDDGTVQTYHLSFHNAAYDISGHHLERLLELYKLHTDPIATLENPSFVSPFREHHL